MTRITTFISVLAMLAGAVAAQTDTTFTYQGELKEAGNPANGSYNIDFALWDASSGGSQVGSTITFNALAVTDGLITVELDFGASALNNSDRWIEIAVNATTLSPRQPITRAPYSIQTRGIIVNDAEKVGMGVNPGSARLRVWNLAGNAIEALSNSRAVEAISTGDMAILASNQSADGMGLFAQHQPSGNQGWLGTPDYGVYGKALDVANDWAGYFLGDGYFSGFVGMGISDPESPLHVQEGSAGNVVAQASSVAVFERSGNGFISILTPDASERGILFGDPEHIANGAIVYNNRSVRDGFEFRTGGNVTNMVIDATGNVGIGTTAPSNKLTVNGGDADFRGFVGIGTPSPQFPLHVRSDLINTIYAENSNTNGAAVYGVATSPTHFGVGVQGETHSSTGVGVRGYASTPSGLTRGVDGQSDSGNGTGVYGYASRSSGLNFGVYGKSNSSSGYDIFAGGVGIDYGSSSSRRWKKNIHNIDDPLKKIAQLRGVYFDWDKEHGGAHDIGMIAEEVGEVLPEIVTYEENGVDAIGMDYSKMTPLLVEAVNALRIRNESLQADNADLQDRLAHLETLVAQLASQQQN